MAKKIPYRHQNEPKIKLKIRIKKEDPAKVIAGRGGGRVLIEGGSMVKRHTRPNPSKQIKGGIAERESSIAVSNVMIVTSGGVATRIGYRIEGTGTTKRHVRVAKKGGEILDKS